MERTDLCALYSWPKTLGWMYYGAAAGVGMSRHEVKVDQFGNNDSTTIAHMMLCVVLSSGRPDPAGFGVELDAAAYLLQQSCRMRQELRESA